MLTPDRIKPYLLHEDPHLRRAAFEYFYQSWSQDPEIVPAILESGDRFGEIKRAASGLDHFVCSGPTIDLILDRLTQTKDLAMHIGFRDFLLAAPIDLLAARAEQILEHPGLDKHSRERFRRRLEWREGSGEHLWEKLQDFSRQNEDVFDVDNVDIDYANDLVLALAPLDFPDTEMLRQGIRNFEEKQSWLGIFLVDLIGERRISEAVPDLLHLIHSQSESDYLLERAMKALVKIGDLEIVRLVQSLFPTADQTFQLWSCDLLASIKREESVDAILALLEVVKDVTMRTFLCIALGSLFSERAIPVIEQQIQSGYDNTLVTLESELLVVGDILGVELPDAEKWRQKRAAAEKAYAAREARWNTADTRFSGAEWANTVNTLDAPGAFRPEPVPTREAIIPTHIRHSTPKIGRNDPCPCGSGKKYKKCCGRAG